MTVICRVISTYLCSLITGVANAASPLQDSTAAQSVDSGCQAGCQHGRGAPAAFDHLATMSPPHAGWPNVAVAQHESAAVRAGRGPGA
jgi:hypothetical protein